MPRKSSEAFLYSKDYPQYAKRLPGLQITDIHEPINMARMRKERLESARRHMKKAGISVMLLLRNENMRYALAYTWLGYTFGGAYAILPLEGDPLIFGHVTGVLQDRRMAPWIKPENFRMCATSAVVGGSVKLMHPAAWKPMAVQFAKDMKKNLAEMGLSKEVLTIDVGVDVIPFMEAEGIKVKVDPEVMVRAQEIKTQDEIECFRVCAAISDLAHYELAKAAEPGKTERELAGYMDYIAMKNGAEPSPLIFVVAGQDTHPNYRYSTNKMLRVGDIFFADCCQISWNGYKSCSYRNFSCVTPPSQAAKDAVKRQVDYCYNALSDCKPGNTTADLMKHWPKEGQFAEGGNAIHGLGLLNYGPPWAKVGFALAHPYELKEGMVFAIETEEGIGDGQGVKIEEMVVVTKTGYEVLTHAPLEIITSPLR